MSAFGRMYWRTYFQFTGELQEEDEQERQKKNEEEERRRKGERTWKSVDQDLIKSLHH